MRRPETLRRVPGGLALVLALGAFGAPALAADAGAKPAASTTPAAPAAAPTGASQLPPGHPPIPGMGASPEAPASPAPAALPPGAQGGSLPPGHPPIPQGGGMPGAEDDDEGGGQPMMAPPGAGPMGRALRDGAMPDPTLPGGTLVVEIRDENDRPLPGVDFTVGQLRNSVAKGESRKHFPGRSDAAGQARFDGLATGTDVSYRVSATRTSGELMGSFMAPPAQLAPVGGQRVVLHVYPLTSALDMTRVAMQAAFYFELKDDAIQAEGVIDLLNMGQNAWVPRDVLIELPKGFRAFNGEKTMNDASLDQIEGKGARIRGTFAPGQHQLPFRFQVPYTGGGDDVDMPITLPSRVAHVRVIAEIGKGVTLDVPDFPAPQAERNNAGQHVMLTEKSLRPGEGATKLRVALRNLPDATPGKGWVAAAAVAIIAIGLWARRDESQTKTREEEIAADATRAKKRLLEEIGRLEAERAKGAVGPETYARFRQALVDALARVLSLESAGTAAKQRRRAV